MSTHHEAGKGSAPRPLTDREVFEREFDRIFRKGTTTGRVDNATATANQPKHGTEDWDEKRIDIIGSNGPTGEHYEGAE